MSVVRQEPAGSAMLRTLPLRVPPGQGESITSWLETFARRYSVSFGEMTAALGIVQRNSATAWLRINSDEIRDVARIARLPVEAVRAMTLLKYTDALPGTDCYEHSGPHALWLRNQGSRYCPACLREGGGRWKAAWYLNWTFACLRHRCLLFDECPQCHRRQRARTPRTREIPPPGTRCRAGMLAASNCQADLTQARLLQFDTADPVLAAQRETNVLLRGVDPGFELYANSQTQLRLQLADLRALTQWVYTFTNPGDSGCHEASNMVASLAEQQAQGRTRSSQRRCAAVNPSSSEVAIGVVVGLKVLTVELNWCAPRVLRALMSTGSSSRSYRLPTTDRACISLPLRQAFRSALLDVRRSWKVQRRFERTGARASRDLPTLGTIAR